MKITGFKGVASVMIVSSQAQTDTEILAEPMTFDELCQIRERAFRRIEHLETAVTHVANLISFVLFASAVGILILTSTHSIYSVAAAAIGSLILRALASIPITLYVRKKCQDIDRKWPLSWRRT